MLLMKQKFLLPLFLITNLFCLSVVRAEEFFPIRKLGIQGEGTHPLHGFSEVLQDAKEKPLWPLSEKHSKISYRLVSSGFKQDTIIFRLDRNSKGELTLTSKVPTRCDEKSKPVLKREKILNEEEKTEFQNLFDSLEFWQMPVMGPVEAEFHFDGSAWILEAVENGKYHLVRRRSPEAGDTMWTSEAMDPGIGKYGLEHGYPSIDRATYALTCKNLVALRKFFIRISDLKVRIPDSR